MTPDENQIRNLVKQHAADVFWFVARLIPRREDAEDVAQDVFVAAYQSLTRYDAERASFKTWLFRIAYNMVLKRLRDGKRLSFVEMKGDELEAIADDAADEILNESLPSRAILLEPAVRQLSDDDQLLLILYYHNSKSLREIAYITGHSESYLASRLQYLRKKLSTIIIKLEQDGKEH
ncbi:MAG: sigma-70 family RNA polymerase sigma factor [Bacteroidaceae bacterium]|nr:sigma-70 family RNA polymerase sigma factor [Bacteroidaceae bacterium]